MAGVEWFLELPHSGLFCSFSAKVSASRSGLIFRPHSCRQFHRDNSDASDASENPRRMDDVRHEVDISLLVKKASAITRRGPTATNNLA